VPTYEYACRECEERLEVVQKFTDDALTTCPSCGGPLRKVFGSVGIAFKGSGFYKTDSRGSSGKSSSSGDSKKSGDGGSGDSGAKSSETSGKSEKSEKSEKKADAPATASSSSGSAAAS
jgi:putative FmdB family regulatory protein